MDEKEKTREELLTELMECHKIHEALKRAYETDTTDRKLADEVLNISETRYRRLFETAKDGILILNAETGMIMDVNPFLIEMLGYSKDQFLEKAIWNIGFFKDIVANQDNFSELQLNEYIRYENMPLETADGQKIHVEFVSNVYPVNHQKVIQCNIRDITKRKKAEERVTLFSKILSFLNRKNEWQNLIGDILKEIKSFTGFDAVGIRLKKGEDYPYFVQNGFTEDFLETELHLCDYDQSGNIILDSSGNPYLACMCGNIICGRTDPSKPFFTEKGSFWSNNTTKLLESTTEEDRQARTRNRCNGEGYESVALIPLRSGDSVIGLLQLNDKRPDCFTLDLINYFEEVASSIGVAYSRSQSEERIKASEREFRMLAEAMPQIVWITRPDGWNIYFNQQWMDYTELSLEESYGDGWIKPFHPDDQKLAWEAWQNATQHGDTYSLECRLRRFDGVYKWWLIRGTPIMDTHNTILKWFGTCTDIHELKMSEAELIKAKEHAEESDRLKSAFLANMSHEIRTPMNGILGFAELLKEPNLAGEEQQMYINVIEKSGARMLNIINDIVNISKIESGQMEILISETNINEQIEYLYTFFKPEAENKGVQLLVKNSFPSQQFHITTDREKVYAILTNLIKNALKFTFEGSIEFGYEKKGNYLEFFVKDSGIGVHTEQQEIIFERFRQGNDLVTKYNEGAGLGLSISKAYVEMLGGKIWVKSEYDQGSTFYFTIPYNIEADEKITTKKSFPTDDERSQIHKIKILIVEDDSDSEMLMEIVIKKVCKEILKARNGIDAVEICRNNPDINLVLMDIRMPEMDGYKATRQIRQFNKDVIIIAQTAFAQTGDREKALESGCNDYISKPINLASFMLLMKKYFKH